MYRIVYYRDLDDFCVQRYVDDSDIVETIKAVCDAGFSLVTLNYLEVEK